MIKIYAESRNLIGIMSKIHNGFGSFMNSKFKNGNDEKTGLSLKNVQSHPIFDGMQNVQKCAWGALTRCVASIFTVEA